MEVQALYLEWSTGVGSEPDYAQFQASGLSNW
jgi:hypothetical protein